MTKQVRMGGKWVVGEFGFTQTSNIITFFCSQNSRNSDRSKGLQLQLSLTVQV